MRSEGEQPAREIGQRSVPREIDRQRRDGDPTTRDRVEIRALAGILAWACGADPVHRMAFRVRGPDHRR